MLKPISEIMGAKLVDLDNCQNMGKVVNWVINPDKKQISALLVKPVGIFAQTLAVSTFDIVEYGPKMVIIKNHSALVAPGELLHLPKRLRQKNRVMGSPVITVSGKKLGNIEDVLFETTDSTLQKIYIKSGLLGILTQPDLIIGVDKIISIEQKKIIVQDDIDTPQTIKETAPVPTTN